MYRPKVTIMILNYNGVHFLGNCINSLYKQTYKNFDIVLIDNNSTDGSIDFVKKNFPQVNIIRNDQNLSFSKAYNIAISMINSEWILILNNDTIVREDWLEKLINSVSDMEAIYGSKILLMNSENILNHAGGYITPIGAGIDIGFLKPDTSIFNQMRAVGYVCGASLLIRKYVFEKIGGFDPDNEGYFEDVDLCWRAWLFGKKVIYVPQSVLYHKYGGTWKGFRENPLRIKVSQISRLLNMIKNLETTTLLTSFFFSIIYDLFRIVKFLRSKMGLQAMYIINGYLHVIINFHRIYRKRLIIQKKRMLTDKDLIKMGLMANTWQCFLEYRRLATL